MAPLKLLGFGPAWGAPSIDPACTKADAWLRFCGLRVGVDFEVEHCSRPQDLPVLQLPAADGGLQLAEADELYGAIASQLGHNPDRFLSDAQRADSAAYAALTEERLGAALLYSWWEDEQNYEAVVRPTLGGMLALPLCYYTPWSMRRRVHSQLARRRLLDAEVAYSAGEAALRALSVRLGGGPFFHGDVPTGVDASAFGWLSAVLRCPLPRDRLRGCMRQHANLVAFCERISEGYFGGHAPLLPASASALPFSQAAPQTPEDAATGNGAAGSSSGAAGKPQRTPKQARFRRRSRNALLGAAGAAFMYLLATDSLSSPKEDGPDED